MINAYNSNPDINSATDRKLGIVDSFSVSI